MTVNVSKRRSWVAIALAGTIGMTCGYALGRDSYPPLDVLLSTSTTIIDQPFSYPTGKPKITAAIVTMQPGASTGWHKHDAPLFAYMLSGNLSVDYGDAGIHAYGPGDAFVEAFQSEHNGTNTGDEPARILAVFAGADGTTNTVPLKSD